MMPYERSIFIRLELMQLQNEYPTMMKHDKGEHVSTRSILFDSKVLGNFMT